MSTFIGARNIEIRELVTNNKDSLKEYNVCLHICYQKLIKWKLYYSPSDNGVIDVIPIISTFEKYLCSPYDGVSEILAHPKFHSSTPINEISHLLFEVFTRNTFTKVTNTASWGLQNDKIFIFLSYITSKENLTCMLDNPVTNNDNNNNNNNISIFCLTVEFPLLFSTFQDMKGEDMIDSANINYFKDITLSSSTILLTFTIRFSNSNTLNSICTVDNNVISKTKTKTNNKNSSEYSKLESNKNINENILEDIVQLDALISTIETRTYRNWLQRKKFIHEMQNISAVIEYDALDFSFITIAVRLKHLKMITLCSVDYRLSPNFPMTVPSILISLHDLQNKFSVTCNEELEYEQAFQQCDYPQWTPEKIARHLFTSSCELIRNQAFS